ncbi:MAG: hypothetical protein QW343_03340 [Candidatus Norongarragalinales archaeon]
MDSALLFALIVSFFLAGLAVFAFAFYWFSRKAREDFAATNSRLSEISFYLNEFAKTARALREKAAEKASAAFVERKLVQAAKEIEDEKEFEAERDKRRIVALRVARKKKEGKEKR